VQKGIAGLAIAVISLLVVAGCGGGGSSTISQQEYERKLEMVCNDGLQQREDAFRVITQEYEELSEEEATPQVQNENLLKLIAVYEETTEEISEIDLPEGNEKKAEEMVQEREDAAAKVQADPQGTRPRFETIFKKSSDLAKTFGANACVV
jgi:hypothetical protein